MYMHFTNIHVINCQSILRLQCSRINVIAVCIYRYVITLGLWSKYDVVGHYSRFVVRILANLLQYDVTLLYFMPQLYCMQTFNFPFCQVEGKHDSSMTGNVNIVLDTMTQSQQRLDGRKYFLI